MSSAVCNNEMTRFFLPSSIKNASYWVDISWFFLYISFMLVTFTTKFKRQSRDYQADMPSTAAPGKILCCHSGI